MNSKDTTSVDPLDTTVDQDNKEKQNDTLEKNEEDPDSSIKSPQVGPSENTTKGRLWLCFKILKVYLFLMCYFLALMSFYYGSYYQRERRFVNLNSLIVNMDTRFEADGAIIPGLLGESFLDVFTKNKTIQGLIGYEFWNSTQIETAAQEFDNNITEAIVHALVRDKYWQAFIIAPNSTRLIYESLASANASNIPAIQKTMTVMYQEGRHFTAFSQYILKINAVIEQTWEAFYASQEVYSPLVTEYLNDTQRESIMASNETMQLLTVHPYLVSVDLSTYQDAVVIGPSQLGLVYAQLFSLYQLQFSMTIYKNIDTKLKFKHYAIYRVISSQLHSFVLSLVYCLITLAFKVNIWDTFGRSSFLVLWLIMFLFFSANNAVHESVMGYILAIDKLPFIGPFIVFYVILNISTTFYPFALTPGFYRIGNGLVMNNCFNAIKPIFYNTTKQYMGRNISILVVWSIVFNIIMIGVTKFGMRKTMQKAKKAAQQRASVSEGEQTLKDNTLPQDVSTRFRAKSNTDSNRGHLRERRNTNN